MKTILFVMLQVILASGILYGYYHLMLRNKKFHQYNRFYLLASVVISVLIPFISIPVYFAESEIQTSVVLQTLQTISPDGFESEAATTPAAAPEIQAALDWNVVLYMVYGLIASLLFIRILISLRKIKAIIRNYPVEELNGVHFINTVEPGTPYSFFRWLFWNRKIELRSEKGEQIFRHEIFHIQQKHSVDIVFMELLTVVFWINPFFHLMKKEVKAIHEFLADHFAAYKTEKWEYAELLLMQALNTQQHLVNPFFHNQIKRRIAMITNPQKTSYRYLRKLLVLPVAALVVALFAFTYKKKHASDKIFKPGKQITIVIDAAHGGTDAGAISPDNKYSEAQIALEIAKQIQSLAKEFDVNVIMTRDDDKFPGNAANKEDGLKKRVEITNKTKPDAFIAIHVNAAYNGRKINQTKYSGFEAYVSDKREDAKGKLLASAILKSLSPVYKTTLELKQRNETGIYVLDHNNYPAVLIQCGYINNPEDLDFITNKENQEKLAKAILKGIVSQSYSGIGFTESMSLDTVPKIHANTIFPPPAKHSPSAEQLQTWKDANMYGVWIDEKRIDNAELSRYMPYDFALYYNSKLEKNAVNYGKHYFQIDLITHERYKQLYPRKWSSVSEILPADTVHPLIVIDGKEYPGLTISNLEKIVSANDIEFINVFKDKASIARYGDRGKSGVIEIKTKKTAPPISEKNQSAGSANIIFEKVEIEPSFPGGELAWKKILESTLNTSIPFQNHAPAGEYTVYIQFIVHTDGSISDIKALTNHGFGMEQEAKRIIENSPRWSPAIQNGRRVNAYKKQRVDFVVGKSTGVIGIYNTTNGLSNHYNRALDPRTLYIGIDNSLMVKQGNFETRNIEATISHGDIKKEGTDFIVRVFKQEDVSINFYTIENGRKISLKDINFSVKLAPEPPVSAPISQNLPKISVSDLKKISIYELLKLDRSTEILSFDFTIDNIKNGVTESVNTGDRFTAQTTDLISKAVVGNTIMVDNIRVKKNDREVKLPSQVYQTID